MTVVPVRQSFPSGTKMHILRGKIAGSRKPALMQCSDFAASLPANLQKSSLLSSDEMQNE